MGILELASDYSVYQKWREDEPGFVDVFIQFPSLLVNSAELIYRLPPLLPRLYSIASAMDPDCNKEEKRSTSLDLLLSVVEYKTPSGKLKRGFCSNYLANAKPDERVALHLKSSPSFHIETRTDGMIPPTILIGAGSGLAPFRGFWQKLNQDSKSRKPLESMWTPMLKYFAPLCQRRESTEASSHTVELIFGCRTECSNLLENETKPLKALLQR